MTKANGALFRFLENPLSSLTGSLPVLALILLFIMFGEFQCIVKTYDIKESVISDIAPPAETITADDFVLEEEDAGAEAYEDPFQMEMPTFADNPMATPAAAPDLVDLTSADNIAPAEIKFDASELQENIEVPAEAYLTKASSSQPAVQKRDSQQIAVNTTVSASTVSNGGGGASAVPTETVSNLNGAGGDLLIAGGGSGTVISLGGSGSLSSGSGGVAGMGRRLSGDNSMSRWILENQSELPPVVRQQLKHEPGKDVTAKSVAIYDNAAYNLYFLYREDDNLLRVLVLTGEEALQYDLPQFDTKNWNVQNGYARWTNAEENSGQRYPLIVNVSPVASITDREKTVMGIILEWLKVTSEG